MTITGGTVSIEDCKKHDGYPDPQYAPTRKVRVELSFATPQDRLDEGLAFLDQALHEAHTRVTQTLGGKTPAREQTVVQAAKNSTAVVEPAKPKGETDKDRLAREAGLTGEAAKPAADKPRRGRPPAAAKTEPVKDEDELGGEPAQTAEPAEEVLADTSGEQTSGDDLGDLLGDEPPIPDADLNKAVQEKQKAFKAKNIATTKDGSPISVALRKYIATFCDRADPAGFTLREIAQPRRREFLNGLTKLE